MLSRRKFLLLLLAMLAIDFGFGRYRMEHGAPPGWKTVRWQAGFGSWCCGGYLLAYDISIPEDYDFSQKCGRAWVESDDAMIDDFLLQFSFFGTSSARYDDKEFDDYLKSGAVHSARSFGRPVSEINVDSAAPYNVGALRFSRSNILLGNETPPPAAEDNKNEGLVARGFRLKGSGMNIISELNAPSIDKVSERIVQSLRPVKGFDLFDAVAGSVPFLDGC